MKSITKVYKNYTNFYEFIREQYAERYEIISPEAIAERLDCSVIAVFKWNINQGPNRVVILDKLANDFNCTPEQMKVIIHYFKTTRKKEVSSVE